MDEYVVSPGADVSSMEALVESLKVEGYEDAALMQARLNHEPVACWAHRGCEGLMGLTRPMEQECPHSRDDCYAPCPAECGFTTCTRPWHASTSDVGLILDPTVDRKAAIKKNCYTCSYFLTHGPRVGERASDESAIPETATSDSAENVTIHLF